jgi:hypothetical protein
MTQRTPKRPLESKKFLLATFAIAGASLVWAASFVAVLANPLAAAHIVSLATMITTLLGAVAGAGITGESFVDWKTSHSFNNSLSEARSESVNINITETPSKEAIRDFERRYANDPSYRPIRTEEGSIPNH